MSKADDYDTEKVDILLDKIRTKLKEYERLIEENEQHFNYEAFDNLPRETQLALMRKAEEQAGLHGKFRITDYIDKRDKQGLKAPIRLQIAAKNRILF